MPHKIAQDRAPITDRSRSQRGSERRPPYNRRDRNEEMLDENDKQIIRMYVNTFRNIYSPNLSPEISLHTLVAPFSQGAIITFRQMDKSGNQDSITPFRHSLYDALKLVNLTLRDFFNDQEKLFSYRLNFEDINNKEISPATVAVVKPTQIIMIKSWGKSQWTTDSACDNFTTLFGL